MKKGLFITFEGGEGTGKTTQISYIENYMEKNKIPYISTREPGGISISEQIRNVVLNKENISMDSRTEALLYAAARRQHLVERVIPSIKEGKIVICDRFIDSSLAYQGYARSLGMDSVMEINEFAIEGYMPDITFYLDIAPEDGLKRIMSNKEREVNRLDLESLNFHRKVREGYKILAHKYSERIKIINANQTKEEVFRDIKDILDKVLGNY